MKAVVYDKSSSPDVLALREVETPVPGENEVLVKIQAVSVNAADYRSMSMGIIPKSKIFGADVAGVVEAVGPGVTRFQPGAHLADQLVDAVHLVQDGAVLAARLHVAQLVLVSRRNLRSTSKPGTFGNFSSTSGIVMPRKRMPSPGSR